MAHTIPRVALDVDEAAAAVGLKPESIKRAIRAGKLRAKRTGAAGGGKYVITVAALEQWIDGMSDA